MSKGILGFIFGVIAGVAAVMAFLHKDAITAAIKGEELPEAPDCCPFSKNDSDDAVELELEPESEAAAV